MSNICSESKSDKSDKSLNHKDYYEKNKADIAKYNMLKRYQNGCNHRSAKLANFGHRKSHVVDFAKTLLSPPGLVREGYWVLLWCGDVL